MYLQQPVWLILIIPLAAAWMLWKLPSRFLRVTRAVVFALLALALCRPALKIPDRTGTVVILADRSASMPGSAGGTEKEIVDLAQASIRGNNRLAVVSFGRHAVVDHSPQSGKFSGFVADIGPDQSDLSAALENALALFGANHTGRILVVSDGRWTGKDPAAAALKYATRGIPIDFRLLQRSAANDLSLSDIRVPETVLPGQAFLLEAIVHAPVGQEVSYEMKRGAEIIAAGRKNVPAGVSRLVFRDRAPLSGVCQYSIAVMGTVGQDPVPENNIAKALVGIKASRPLLVTSSAGENSGLAKALKANGMDIRAQAAAACTWNLADISQYSAIVLENTFADDIGHNGLENLALWVEHAGGGLMLSGGRNSYGTGGYFKSPLEKILPISMELRSEHRKLSLAIVVALDRSGSMAMPCGGGKRKIDLANIGTVQVLDLLSPLDEFGAVAVDSSSHVVVDLGPVEKKMAFRNKIMQIDSLGGGIFIYEALSTATKMLLSAKAATRHIILFADASDSEEPGAYKELLAQASQANITVSVIGLGGPDDCDAELLRDIARRGGGTCTFTSDATQIPRLFAQDTFSVSRSSFIEEETSFRLKTGMQQLSPYRFGIPPAVGGYNLCYARPGANLAALTEDEYQAPIVAYWFAGSGRVLCLTAEADGKYSGAFGRWPEASKFLCSLAGWTAGRSTLAPDDLLITQNVKDGLYTLELHLDPERINNPFSGTPRAIIIHGEPGSKPAVVSPNFTWKSADNLTVEFPMSGGETLLATVEITGRQPVRLVPVCLKYSAEFMPDREGRGAATLQQLAVMTGGKERIDVANIWKELPSASRNIELMSLLILGALLAFLIEIFERRTGLLGNRHKTAALLERPIASVLNALNKIRNKPAHGPERHPPLKHGEHTPKVESNIAKKPDQPGEITDTISAMRQARKNASKRTDKI